MSPPTSEAPELSGHGLNGETDRIISLSFSNTVILTEERDLGGYYSDPKEERVLEKSS